MENGQRMKAENESESQVDTSGGSIKSVELGLTGSSGLQNSSPRTTTATTQKDSPKTWRNAELEVLRSKAGLVAGALADFQSAGGLVAVKAINYPASGSPLTATKLILVAPGLNLVAVETGDGLELQIQE